MNTWGVWEWKEEVPSQVSKQEISLPLRVGLKPQLGGGEPLLTLHIWLPSRIQE